MFLSIAPTIDLETAFRHFCHFKPTVNKENTRTGVLADDGFKRQTLRMNRQRHLMMVQTNRQGHKLAEHGWRRGGAIEGMDDGWMG